MDLTVAGVATHLATGGLDHVAGRSLVVLIHGAGMDRTVWQFQARWLAYHGWNVAAVDLPGHGRSGGVPLPSIAQQAAWTARLVEELDGAPAAVVGHSMGSFIGIELAATRPDLVSRLALLGVAARMPVHPDLLEAARRGDHLAFDLVTSWALGRPAHLGGHPTPGLWMTGATLRVLEHAPPGVLHVDLSACDAYEGATEAARRIGCPTLLLLGEVDLMTRPRAAAPLAEAIAGSTTVVVPGAGHLMMVEQPDATIDALDTLLAVDNHAASS